MSHDALLILSVLGGLAALFLIGWVIVAIRRAVSHVGRKMRECIDTAKSLIEGYDAIKLRENLTDQDTFKELVALKEALGSIDGRLQAFVESGKPLEAIPNILNFQVESIRDLRTAVRTLQRTLTGDIGGQSYQEPDDQRDQTEDEIQSMMAKARCSREEAVERLAERKLWSRMGNLVGGTGTDD